jgi:Ca2+-transporting ATPase
MQTMAHRKAIIRRLVAVETLGAATVICSDKTGTLTLNQMTVRRLYTGGRFVEVSGEGYEPIGEFRVNGTTLNSEDRDGLDLLLRIGALCNDARLSQNEKQAGIIGDPTEGALVVAAAKAGLEKEGLEQSYPRLDEIAFESERQYMATLHSRNGAQAGNVLYVKGSTERILAFSRYVVKDGQVVPFQPSDSQEIAAAAAEMAQEALRVMALAYAELPAGTDKVDEEVVRNGLVFSGLAGMADPPREEAKEAIKLCKQAGIKVVMITGDNKITAGPSPAA